MQITIVIQRPRRRVIAVIIAALALSVPSVTLAHHQFVDVGNDHPFHSQISAIAGAGITGGFPDGGYHPSDVVTRQSMAAFMERGFGRAALVTGAPPETASITVTDGNAMADPVVIRKLTITVPGASNSFSPKQLVHLQGHVSFFDTMDAAAGCPCEFRAFIREMASGAISVAQLQTLESVANQNYHYSFAVEGLFGVTPGAHTFQLLVGLEYRADIFGDSTFTFGSTTSLSATTFPFGPTGTSALAAAGTSDAGYRSPR